MQETKLRGPVEYIKEAFRIYSKKENFIFFARIMVLLTVISTFFGFIADRFYPLPIWKDLKPEISPFFAGFITLSLVMVVVGLWVQTTTYFTVFKIGDNEEKIIKLGFLNAFRYFIVSMVYFFLIVIGVVLLVIPAFIFALWFAFATYFVLDKKLKIIPALKASKLLVKNNFWKVFIRLAVFSLFALVVNYTIGLIPYAGSAISLFITPFFILPSYLLYRDLSAGLDDSGTI